MGMPCRTMVRSLEKSSKTGLSSVWWRLPDVDVADGRVDAADAAGDVAGGDAGGRTRRDTLLRSV